MNYYIFQQDPRVQPQPSILRIPDDIDPEEWLSGKRMTAPKNPLRLKMSERSGKFRGDIIHGLVTLFHNKLREELIKQGIKNVQYFPVELENPEGKIEHDYWLVNIIGVLDAVDKSNSVIEPMAMGGRGTLKSFKIDPTLTKGYHIFRIPDAISLIIIDEKLHASLSKHKPPGAWMLPTEEYDGF